MSRFWADAQQVMEVASAGEDSEFGPSDLAIVVDHAGAIRMVDASGWNLHSLQLESGASSIFRVSRCSGRIRVEGRCGVESYVLDGKLPS